MNKIFKIFSITLTLVALLVGVIACEKEQIVLENIAFGIGYTEGESNQQVTKDITLPLSVLDDKVSIMWTVLSGEEVITIIDNKGKITQGPEDVIVSLKARLSYLDQTYEKTINFLVMGDKEPGKFDLTVTFDTNGGKTVAPVLVVKGNLLTKPNNPVRTGYKFLGWYLDGVIFNFTATKITSNISLLAKWEEESVTEKFTVNFDTSGGTAIAAIEVLANDLITKPTDPIRSSYKFLGWYLNDELFNFTTEPITDNLILLAKWQEEIADEVLRFSNSGSEHSYTSADASMKVLADDGTSHTILVKNANNSITGEFLRVLGHTKNGGFGGHASFDITGFNEVSQRLKKTHNLTDYKYVALEQYVNGSWLVLEEITTKINQAAFTEEFELTLALNPAVTKYRLVVQGPAGAANANNYGVGLVWLELVKSPANIANVSNEQELIDAHNNLEIAVISFMKGFSISSEIQITRDDIVIRGNGHTLKQTGTTFTSFIIEGVTGIVIDNLKISDGEQAINITDAKVRIVDLTFIAQSGNAIIIQTTKVASTPSSLEVIRVINSSETSSLPTILVINNENQVTGAVYDYLLGIDMGYFISIKNVPGIADKSNLLNEIDLAKIELNSGFLFTKQSKNSLLAEISSAEALINDHRVTQTLVDAATLRVRDAKNALVKKDPETYVVTFDDGAALKVVNVTEGFTVAKPADPVQVDFVFVGWYLNDKAYNFATIVESSFRLTAKWSNDIPHEYYNSIGYEGTSGNTLLSILKGHITKGVKYAGYGGGLNGPLAEADRSITNQSQVYLIYNGELMSPNNSGSGGASVWNKEHVWPNSKMDGHPKGDIHNLRVCQAQINSNRSNYPFMEGSGQYKAGPSSFFPGDDHKGDVARIMFYMVTIHPTLNLSSMGGKAMFLKWHKDDPVDAFELQRNEVLFEQSIQPEPLH